MFRDSDSPSGRTLPPINAPAVSLEERVCSCERALRFLTEETARSRGMVRLQLQQIGHGGGAGLQETAQLRSQLVSTQAQMASFMRQSTRQTFLEVERERLLTAHEDLSNQVRLDTNIGRVAGDMRDLSHRVSQTSQLAEQQLEGINRDVEAGAVSLKRLSGGLSSLSTGMGRSEERLSSRLSLAEERCVQQHQALSAAVAGRSEKWKEDFAALERGLSDSITEQHSSLSSVAEDLKDLTTATARRVQQLAETETRERNTLEKILVREASSTRDQFDMRCGNIEKTITNIDNDTRQRLRKLSKLLVQQQSFVSIVERQLEAERLRANHLLLAEVSARKEAVSGLFSEVERTRADLLKLLGSAHQSNQLTEVRLQQLESSLEQSSALLSAEIKTYRSDCLEASGQLTAMRESVTKELAPLQAVLSLREEFRSFRTELDARFSGLSQRIDSLQVSEKSISGEVLSFGNKLLQMKQEQSQRSDELSLEINKSQQKLIELSSLVQPLVNTPEAIGSLTRFAQQLESSGRQQGEETLQLHRALQGLQQLFTQKLHLEETARISALTSLSNELRLTQLQIPHPYPPTDFTQGLRPIQQPGLLNAPPPKPSTLHIPQQPSLNLASLPSSLSFPSTCASLSNLFLHPPTTLGKVPHSTPKDQPTSLSDPKYTTSPIEGEVRVVSSIRSLEPQEQRDNSGSTETSNDESPGNIADRFQEVRDEHAFTPLVQEPVPSFPSSPKESRRESSQSAQNRALSMIREESETLVSSDSNLEGSLGNGKIPGLLVTAGRPQQQPADFQKNESSDLQQQETADLQKNESADLQKLQSAGSQKTESDVLSPLPQFRSESSGSFFSRHLSLPDSLGREKPPHEYRRLRTVESVARQSFIKSPEPQEQLIEFGEDDALNEWGIYQAIFWVRIKMKWMRPVMKMRQRNETSHENETEK